ncbi:MAG: FGGY-family carbohydrate kinase [Rhizobiaceae bacterium]
MTRDKQRVAVIDVGKTNAKVAVFDLGLMQELECRTTANTVIASGIYPHFDVDMLWAFILSSLSALGHKHELSAISVTTHGASAALLAEDGSLALPVLDYEFDGPQSLTVEYDAVRPSFEATGSPRLPAGLNLGAQLFWQKRNFPEAFARTRWIVMYPQYWAHRLCGVLANEVTSLGCHTDLWDYRTYDYSELVNTEGWRNRMPSLRKATDCLGNLKPEIAKQTGLALDTQVYCGIHDSNASLYPHLLSSELPFSIASTGTWVISMAVGSELIQLDLTRDTLMNVNALGAPVPSARFMGGREFQLLSNGAKFQQPSKDDEDLVIARVAQIFPSAVKDCGPFPDRSTSWVNATDLTPAQTQAAISFYLALMTGTCLDLIGATGPTVLEGPFCENSSFVRMLSAATHREVHIGERQSTGTTLGAALLCTESLNLSTSKKAILETNQTWRDYSSIWKARVAKAEMTAG